jgi:hypothetical protein
MIGVCRQLGRGGVQDFDVVFSNIKGSAARISKRWGTTYQMSKLVFVHDFHFRTGIWEIASVLTIVGKIGKKEKKTCSSLHSTEY